MPIYKILKCAIAHCVCEISVNMACFGMAFEVFSELFLIILLGFEINMLNCHRSDDRSYGVNWAGDFV